MSLCQICALPRSGTAFLTVLMNLGPSCIAFHELIVSDLHWKDTLESYSDYPGIVCDVGTYQFLPKASISDSRKVYIRQDPHESARRASAAFGYQVSPSEMRKAAELADRWCEEWNPLIIEQAHLFNLSSLRSVWEWCNQTDPFPQRKVEVLLQMRIDRFDGERVFARDCLKGREHELWA